MRTKKASILAGVLTLALAGCVAKKDYEAKVAELEATAQKIAALEQTVATQAKEIASLKTAKDEAATKTVALEAARKQAAKLTTDLEGVRKLLTGREAELAKVNAVAADLRGKFSGAQQQLTSKLDELNKVRDQFTGLQAKAVEWTDKGKLLSQVQQQLMQKDKVLASKDAALLEQASKLGELMKQIEQVKQLKQGTGAAVGGALKMFQK